MKQFEKILNLIIIIGCILAMIIVWPLGKIRYTKQVRGHAEEFQYSLNLVEQNTIQQEFIPQYDYLQKIEVSFCDVPAENFSGVIHLNLLDKEGSLVAHDYKEAKDIQNGYVDFVVDSAVNVGEQYSFYIYTEGMSELAPKLVYRTLSASGPIENTKFYMNGIYFDDASAAGGYDYGLRLRLSQVLLYDSFILFLTMIILQEVKFFFKVKKNNR